MMEQKLLLNSEINDRLSTKLTKEIMSNKEMFENTVIYIDYIYNAFSELTTDDRLLLRFDYDTIYNIEILTHYDSVTNLIESITLNFEGNEIVKKIFLDGSEKVIKDSNYSDVREVFGAFIETLDNLKYEFINSIDRRKAEEEKQLMKKYTNEEIYKSVSREEAIIKNLEENMRIHEQELEQMQKEFEERKAIVEKALKYKKTIQQIKAMIFKK